MVFEEIQRNIEEYQMKLDLFIKIRDTLKEKKLPIVGIYQNEPCLLKYSCCTDAVSIALLRKDPLSFIKVTVLAQNLSGFLNISMTLTEAEKKVLPYSDKLAKLNGINND